MLKSWMDSRLERLDLFAGILLVLLCKGYGITSLAANESDRLALLDFKSLITQDPFQIMSSWNDSVHFCNWVGVSCNSSTKRVVTLNLESQSLAGSLPPSIGNLTYLTGLNLQYNGFVGGIPEEIGRLTHLQHLNLTSNDFKGKLPSNLTSGLTGMEVAYNHFVGDIPDQLGSLTNLVFLGLGANNLTGKLPAWIGNFSSLFTLSLALNNFYGGIPDDLGKLKGLGFFTIYGNYLSGTIPSSLYNISTMYYFSVTQNQLHGEIPQDVGLTMPRLQIFAGGVNNFTGSIPASLSNASGLQVLDFAENGLTGTIPTNLGSLKNLVRLNFDQNLLGSWEIGGLDFISSLTNCTILEVLGLAQNRFGGELPVSIANLSTHLQRLTLGQNLIRGIIPVGVGDLVNLTLLGLEGNLLNGSVPDAIGKLQNLQGLYLNVNGLSGPIPSSLGNLTRLTRLFLEENRFEGSIPSSLGSCRNLQNLNLSSNYLNGTIPKEIIGLPSLSIALVMSHNSLTGSLPPEVGSLVNLVELDLSENKMSGEIPDNLGSCVSLERLHLESNTFSGKIPPTFQSLRGIVELDLASNNLSGTIPEFLCRLSSLQLLNLSYNNFEGAVPEEGIFANASTISVTGNNKLCNGIPALHLPTCSLEGPRKTRTVFIVLLSISGVVLLLVILYIVIALIYKSKRSRKKNPTRLPLEELEVGMSYSELWIATDGFCPENLIGSGSFGSVYKGVLPGDGNNVAIKVLNLQRQGASKSFIDEFNASSGLRHRNLLRIIFACSSVDHQGNDFRALVFELMPNGSLDHWLHPRSDRTKRLSLIQRLNIAIHVASALDHLHHYCETTIVHCDLKPSNVLLDEDMTAHVGDFGLAKFLLEASEKAKNNQAMTEGLKGSIGYIPPEYGLSGQVSTLGDAYSYGILLLEMFTGKTPTDEMFKEDLSIRKFVKMALPDHVMDIIDPLMMVEQEMRDTERDEDELIARDIESDEDELEVLALHRDTGLLSNARSKIEVCLVSIMEVALSCSVRSPGKRMPMNVAVNKLQGIRDSLLKSQKRKGDTNSNPKP